MKTEATSTILHAVERMMEGYMYIYINVIWWEVAGIDEGSEIVEVVHHV